MEISSIYKVDDIEFATKEEAEKYIEEKNRTEKETEETNIYKEEKLEIIHNAEKELALLYKEYENEFLFLPNRSNNIKQLLRDILKED